MSKLQDWLDYQNEALCGRDSWKQRNHDFSAAQTDAQMAYIEAERECRELRELIVDLLRNGEFVPPLGDEFLRRAKVFGIDPWEGEK